MHTFPSMTLSKLFVADPHQSTYNFLLPHKINLYPRYSWQEGGPELAIGTQIRIEHGNNFKCSLCERSVKKLFSSFCFPCLKTKAAADMCVLNPEQCHFLLGTCREPGWGLQHCYQKHYLYLAYTDKFKVGITRATQIPTRWYDQGATQASLLAQVSSRHQAGVLEKSLSPWVSDKSHWSKMLTTGNAHAPWEAFEALREQLFQNLKTLLSPPTALKVPLPEEAPHPEPIILCEKSALVQIHYPMKEKLDKVTSTNLDKNPKIIDEILGIKGQYLLFPKSVLNIRRHEGYVVNIQNS